MKLEKLYNKISYGMNVKIVVPPDSTTDTKIELDLVRGIDLLPDFFGDLKVDKICCVDMEIKVKRK